MRTGFGGLGGGDSFEGADAAEVVLVRGVGVGISTERFSFKDLKNCI